MKYLLPLFLLVGCSTSPRIDVASLSHNRYDLVECYTRYGDSAQLECTAARTFDHYEDCETFKTRIDKKFQNVIVSCVSCWEAACEK